MAGTPASPCQPEAGASARLSIASYDVFIHILTTNASGTTTQPIYDGAGDLTYSGNHQYLYDPEGRICAEAGAAIGGLTTAVQYLYDAEGRRVAKGTIQPVTANGQPTLSCDVTINQFKVTN